MSVLVPIDSILQHHNEQIMKSCIVKERVKIPGSKYPKTEKHNFYKVIRDNNDRITHVSLPHYTGRKIMQCLPTNIVTPWKENFFTGILRPHQQEDMDKSYDTLKKYGSSILELPTGYGKTVAATYLPCVLRTKTLFTTIRVTLIESMCKTIKEFSTLKYYIVGTDIDETKFNEAHIILCGRENLHKLTKDMKSKIGMLIIDEAHSFCTQLSMNFFLDIHPRYVVAMSATPDKVSGMSGILDIMCGPHRIVRTLTAKFSVIKANTGILIPTTKAPNGKADWQQLQKSVMLNTTINDKIVNFITKQQDKKILVLAWNKQHINVLYEMLVKIGEKVDYMTGTKQSYKNGRILLGTISKISTGFDEKNTCIDFDETRLNMLILLGSTKDVALLTQMSGRVFRSDESVIVDVIHDNTILKGHWYSRKKWYDQHAESLTTIKI